MRGWTVVACCLALAAPVLVHFDVTWWRPDRYPGYESILQVTIPAEGLAILGGVGLVVIGIVSLVKRHR